MVIWSWNRSSVALLIQNWRQTVEKNRKTQMRQNECKMYFPAVAPHSINIMNKEISYDRLTWTGRMQPVATSHVELSRAACDRKLKDGAPVWGAGAHAALSLENGNLSQLSSNGNELISTHHTIPTLAPGPAMFHYLPKLVSCLSSHTPSSLAI